MNKTELASVLERTDTIDRDILDRLITGFSQRQTSASRIANAVGVNGDSVLSRLVTMERMNLVAFMRNGNVNRFNENYSDGCPGPSVGWIYTGGRISEFFELRLEQNFA